MINQECEGEQIVHALVKNALDIYVEMGKRLIKYYEKDFEEAMLKKTATFYSQKASNWITSKSYEDYMLKVVEHGLLIANAMELQEKKQPDGEAPSIDEM
ncbi:hypothetical protein L1049_017218 [Liquidambar formosana]|uniref:Cullin N-terminal domain-containing protein n=1 Tax=Liquidambar formosana TaxID=63359 RepID=A0AAP0S7R6_LIQFO